MELHSNADVLLKFQSAITYSDATNWIHTSFPNITNSSSKYVSKKFFLLAFWYIRFPQLSFAVLTEVVTTTEMNRMGEIIF